MTPSISSILLLSKYFCFLDDLYPFIPPDSTEVSNLSARLKNWKMSLAQIGPLLGVISKVTAGIGPQGWSSPHDSDTCFTPCYINPAANGLNWGIGSTGLPGGSWVTERVALVSDCVLYESFVACRHPREPCSSSKSWAEWGWDWGAETNLLYGPGGCILMWFSFSEEVLRLSQRTRSMIKAETPAMTLSEMWRVFIIACF